MNIRFPFSDIIGTRDTRLNKDSLTTNVFFDAVPEGEALVKRPGLANLTSALGLGINGAMGFGQGLFYYEDQVFSFNSPNTGYYFSSAAASETQMMFLVGEAVAPATQAYVLIIDENENITKSLLPAETGADPVEFQWKSIIYTGSQFCILGETGDSSTDPRYIILRSPDGGVWTEVATGVLPPTDLFRFVGAAVIGGLALFADTTLEISYTSVDNGATWARNVLGLSQNPEIESLDSNNTSITAGQVSTLDGITWTPSTGDFPEAPLFIIHTSGGTYLTFQDGFRYLSANGIAWTRTALTGDFPVNGDPVVIGDGIYVSSINISTFPNRNSGRSSSSDDGLAWEYGEKEYSPSLTTIDLFYLNNNYYALSFAPDNVFLGFPYAIYFVERSEDGITWTRSAIDIALFSPTPTIIDGLV